MQPIIGVTMCIDRRKRGEQDVDYSEIRREYGQALRRAGAQPIFLDPSIDPQVAVRLCDGIVISGGEDLDPAFYGQTKRGHSPEEPRLRTDWEYALIAACDEREVPILGVCYGVQLLNVYYGGTLYQDIAQEYSSEQAHGSSTAPVRHEVNFERDFLGYAVGQTANVIARHHQAVAELAEGFRVAARAHDRGIEAIVGHGHYGIQWHAESDASGEMIYGSFVRHCALRRRRLGSSHILADFFSLLTPRR